MGLKLQNPKPQTLKTPAGVILKFLKINPNTEYYNFGREMTVSLLRVTRVVTSVRDPASLQLYL